MIDFLKKSGISADTIKRLNETMDRAVLENLCDNEDECIKIIEAMKYIGISIGTIEELLLYQIDVFMMSSTKFLNRLKKYNTSSFVQAINNDWLVIKEIYKD